MRCRTRLYTVVVVAALGAGTALGAGSIGSAAASGPAPLRQTAGLTPVRPDAPKVPVMTGAGGAVSSVDDVATQVGIDVLRKGGNAADAAVAVAATLGVTEPYSAGIGGGGFLVFYNARTGVVQTIDGREAAPATFTPTTFTGLDGKPLDFATVVSSGLSVGVPGTPALWDEATRRWGTQRLSTLLKPAEEVARRGFVVDATFSQQTADNAARFAKFPETAKVFLPGGQAPAVGSVLRNPDLARAYRELRTSGVQSLYDGLLAEAIVDAARRPRTVPGVSVFPGQITRADLARYDALVKAPTRTRYRGLDVYGMSVPSSGGIAVGEALNLLESYDKRTGTNLSQVTDTQYLHRFAEASATAFADRNRWIGGVPGVPAEELVSQGFADERACRLFDPAAAHARPIPFGQPDGSYACGSTSATQVAPRDDHGTTHLTVADRWGNVASYTLTIEQTGGSGITVPGYGFLLNNELTDFNFTPVTAGVPDPNLPGASKRPRSSMAPTIVIDSGRPVLALGSPGGATIITTVGQVLTGFLDRDQDLVDAIAAPRISSRNGPTTDAEPTIVNGPDGAALTAMGHLLKSVPEIGAATAIRLLGNDRFEAAAETTRRGGGSAQVVKPDR
jgi:gamma-glutamyltranspeptidase/glutathione hydrolase